MIKEHANNITQSNFKINNCVVREALYVNVGCMLPLLILFVQFRPTLLDGVLSALPGTASKDGKSVGSKGSSCMK